MNRYCSLTVLLFIFSPSFNVVAESHIPEFCRQHISPVSKANVIGEVRDAITDQPLYCEYHIFSSDAKKTKVEYRSIDQTLIATKNIDYSPSLTRPNVVQKDLRHNELRKAVFNDNSNLGINVSYRKPNKSDIKSIQIEPADNLVIDAGFDEAVRAYWYTLVGGEKLVMDFLSPVHLDTIKLTIKKSNSASCYKQAYDTVTQACFLIRPSNVVLNLFVKPLALVYDLETRRLLSFKGAVNITNEKGGTQNAVIKYYYEG